MDPRFQMLQALIQSSGGQRQDSPFYSQSRPYGEINDAGAAMNRDGIGAIMRMLGYDMSPNQRVRAGWSDALPMATWGTPRQ